MSTSNFRWKKRKEGEREGEGDLGEDEWGEHVAPQKKDEQKRGGRRGRRSRAEQREGAQKCTK